ncbi:MAG: FtsQ-type POTRA domain-containing protein [Puniceicoccaceae bacterium]|nr:MAG: FtsQ-type POTRA domain-containing protein [Puniceicoccaceae bacterium]
MTMARRKKTTTNERVRGSSWRSIPQSVGGQARTGEARRRRRRHWLGLAGAFVCVAALVAGALYALGSAQGTFSGFGGLVRGEPLRAIELRTDGVLDQAWIERVMMVEQGTPLVRINLAAAKARLEREGQVRLAVVSRRFPDTLVVTLEERVPVARILIAEPHLAPEVRLVARDGVVFNGRGHDREMLERLPFLEVSQLVRDGEGIAPIEGMERVADFLERSQNLAPDIRRSWRVVQLREDGLIGVRGSGGPVVIFGQGELLPQLQRLDYILDFYRTRPRTPPRTIDLSLPGQVPVEHATTRQAGPRARATTTFSR